jgi:hypothetical protein
MSCGDGHYGFLINTNNKHFAEDYLRNRLISKKNKWGDGHNHWLHEEFIQYIMNLEAIEKLMKKMILYG